MPNISPLSCICGQSSQLAVCSKHKGELFGPAPAEGVMLGRINAISQTNEESAGLCASAAKR